MARYRKALSKLKDRQQSHDEIKGGIKGAYTRPGSQSYKKQRGGTKGMKLGKRR